MKIYRGFTDRNLRPHPRAVAIGVFDGVHRGHQAIIHRMLRDAHRQNIRSCVVTFDPHPEKILKSPQAGSAAVLNSLAHRLSLFASMGVQECVIVRFDRRFSKVPANQFLERDLIGRLGMASLSVGRGFRFGSGGSGNARLIRAASKRWEFRFFEIAPKRRRGKVVSSTLIRQLILSGRFREASHFLGRAYAVMGTVVHGSGRGRKIGFPTANLNLHHEILPPEGVYAAWGEIGHQRRLPAVVHIGKRPTFSEVDPSLEVHFLDYHKSLYNKEIHLEFVRLLRPVRRFPSIQALQGAIRRDIQRARKVLSALQEASQRV